VRELRGEYPVSLLCQALEVPRSSFYYAELKNYVRDILLSSQALRRGYFKKEVPKRLIDEHQKGRQDHGHRLWALVTFEMWHRVFIDRDISL